MNTQRPLAEISVYTDITMQTIMDKGCVVSKGTIKYDGPQGFMIDEVLWDVVFNACRHMHRMSHLDFYHYTKRVHDAILYGEFKRIQCAQACPIDVELIRYFGQVSSIIRL